MEVRAPFHFSILVVMILCSCSNKRVIRNVDEVSVKTSRGITTVDDTIFTGTLIAFNDSGDTTEVSNYRNGKKTGIQARWWENGVKRSEYNYNNNEFQGISRDWTQTGLLVRQMNYDNGHENGLQQLWDDDGKIRANYVARNGRNYGLTGVKGCGTVWDEDSVRVH